MIRNVRYQIHLRHLCQLSAAHLNALSRARSKPSIPEMSFSFLIKAVWCCCSPQHTKAVALAMASSSNYPLRCSKQHYGTAAQPFPPPFPPLQLRGVRARPMYGNFGSRSQFRKKKKEEKATHASLELSQQRCYRTECLGQTLGKVQDSQPALSSPRSTSGITALCSHEFTAPPQQQHGTAAPTGSLPAPRTTTSRTHGRSVRLWWIFKACSQHQDFL